jgi:hypothetical protein
MGIILRYSHLQEINGERGIIWLRTGTSEGLF